MSSKSEQMSRVRSRDTGPERLMRQELSQRGVHYRLHRRDLPGRPDIYIGRLHLAIFINGCFWHGHTCRRGKRPASNVQFWDAKIARNMERDAAALRALAERGITTLVVWTCAIGDFSTIATRVARQYRNAQ